MEDILDLIDPVVHDHDQGFEVKVLTAPDPVYARQYIEHCMHNDGYNLVQAVADFINRHEIQNPTKKLLKMHLDDALYRDFKTNALDINEEGDDDLFSDDDSFFI